MGYASRLTGRWHIEPELPVRLVPGKYLPRTDGAVNEHEVVFVVEDRPVVVEGETEYLRRVVGVEPGWEDAFSMYGVEDKLIEIVEALHKLGATATGYLQRRGEEQGDVQRYSMQLDVLVVDTASLAWPDGTKVAAYPQ